MEMNEKKNLRKVPMFSAAALLSELCDRIDNAEELNDELLAQFNAASTSLEESIDRRKYVLEEVDKYIELARFRKKNLDENIKRLQRVQDRIIQTTKQMVEEESKKENPIIFKDTLGNKLTIRKNSNAHLVLALDLREAKSVSNILDDAAISLLEIDAKYIKQVSYTTLNTEKVKADLGMGIIIPWASLHLGTHLRGLK